jgi:methylase of polypeptide subunit release factors
MRGDTHGGYTACPDATPARIDHHEEADVSEQIQMIRGTLASHWLAARFRLFERRRHRSLVLEHVGGMPLVVLPDVFNPTLFGSSQFLLSALPAHVQTGMRVLDMGTGSGIGALGAARLGAQVVAVDILPQAVRCARANALLNGLDDRIDVRHGDLFAPVRHDRFDLVLFNPPYFFGEPREPWETAWRSPDALSRFTQGLTSVLQAGGAALLVLSSAIPRHETLLDSTPLHRRVVERKRYGRESMTIELWTTRDDGRAT